MKVSNNKVGGPQGKIDSAKLGKTDSAQAPKKDMRAGLLQARDMKESASVDVSERAQMMQKAKGIAGDFSVDEAKVARLQKMIDEGKYNVDAEKIADKLVDDHLLIPD